MPLPAGAQSFMARLRPAKPEPPADGVVAAFEIIGRAVPWKAPNVTKNGTFSPKEMRAWKEAVTEVAVDAMAGRPPFAGPVVLHLEFIRARAKARPHERLWVGRPDWDNLSKSFADSLNGVVFVDDAQVVEAHVTKRRGDRDSVRVRVEAFQGGE